MSTVQAEIEIDAPIEKVWETVMDPHRLGDWVTIHKSVENVSPIPLRRGATGRDPADARLRWLSRGTRPVLN